MDIFISNKAVIKTVTVPPSKSYAQRAILASALGKNATLLFGIGESHDVKNILNVARNFGALIEATENGHTITGYSNTISPSINVGESGLGIRLSGSLAAVLKGDFILNGKGSLLTRPLTAFTDFLPQLGIECTLNNGFLPLTVKGNAKAGNFKIDGTLSSQYLSGLLMALPLLEGDSTITVNNLKSKPYIDITIDVLKQFGIEITHNDYAMFHIPGGQKYNCKQPFYVEGDYSGASIWMALGAITGGITIKGLNEFSAQGDRAMLDALTASGVSYKWEQKSLVIGKNNPIPFEFDANECPDLFPSLVVLAAACEGTTIIKGVKRLFHKESNRALVLQSEFAKLGLTIKLVEDEMHIFGTGKLASGEIASHNDHRIAMAGAAAAALTPKGITIRNAESVNKSYPNFWEAYT